MTKKIYIARHAESLYGNFKDHARPLSLKGIEDCKKLGQVLYQLGELPKLIIASDSVRTLETANHLKKAMNLNINIIADSSLYNCKEEELLRVITLINGDISSLMIIGHNPTIEKFCFSIISQNCTDNSIRIPTSIIPATIMAFEAKVDNWITIQKSDFKYRWFLQP
ncbi:MAG: SixA phosphatase family protein [Alphaproteobacteria bacterium]